MGSILAGLATPTEVAIILVFPPIFYPVIEALRPSVAQTWGSRPTCS